jgi:hypothetical protein
MCDTGKYYKGSACRKLHMLDDVSGPAKAPRVLGRGRVCRVHTARQNHDAAYSYSSPKTYHLSHSFPFQLVTQTAMADLPPPVQGPTAKERK